MLKAWPRRRVRLAELWTLLDKADPATRLDGRRRRILADVIHELATVQLVDLPAARSYDRTEDPAVPAFLTLIRHSEPEALRDSVAWHPALAWVPGASLTRSQVTTMEQVNLWLHENRDRLTVPSRERSLEIFGDEKALDRLTGSVLFGPGRLTLALLRCRRVAPPLHCEPAGDGDVLLVVENSDTFDSLLTVLRVRGDHRIGQVGWGAGTGFEASVLSIARLDPPAAEVRYFGDLDENGLRIPFNGSALAESIGLPSVRPATGLYSAMLWRGRAQAGQRKVTAEAAAVLSAWLDPGHREAATSLLLAGKRLAQEAVGLSYLSNHDGWLENLD
jgi:hypothetical protein